MADPPTGSLSQMLGPQRSREELLEQGVPVPEANRLAVRSNLQGALEVSFQRWGRWWLCAVILLFLGLFCIIIWSQWIYDATSDEQCDQPLKKMLRLLYIIIALHAFQREIIRHLLCYSMTRDGPMEPCRVTLFRRCTVLATAVWPLAATWMLANVHVCNSRLRLAVTVIAAYYAVVVVVAILVPMFLISVMLCLVRRGLVRLPRSENAAPDDLIERLPKARFDPALFDDSGRPGSYPSSCCICLEAFDDREPITRSPCGTVSHHAFHTSCLQGWLQCARTCPLCRKDLLEAAEGRDVEVGAALES